MELCLVSERVCCVSVRANFDVLLLAFGDLYLSFSDCVF